jgi:hypothetical protein
VCACKSLWLSCRRCEVFALHVLLLTAAATPAAAACRLDMLRDIASGMVFLHSRKPPIVHGDLRSPNLVRTQSWLRAS